MHWTEKLAHIGTAVSALAALIAILITQQQIKSKQDDMELLLAGYKQVLDQSDNQSTTRQNLFALRTLWSDGASSAKTAHEIWSTDVVQKLNISEVELIEALLMGMQMGVLRPSGIGQPVVGELPLQWDRHLIVKE